MRFPALFFPDLAPARAQPITIRAATMLDGKGGIHKNVRPTIEGTKIVRVAPAGSGPVTYDLGSLTLMPDWIDAHVHNHSHFNKQRRADTNAESPAQLGQRMQASAWQTIQAVFATILSP